MIKLAIMSDNVKIAYEDLDYGFPVFFIHGWAATRNFWNCIRDLKGFRKILIDLRGHGESDRAKSYDLERIVLDVYELISDLGIRECYVVGHSLGGIIATKLASEFPELTVKKLILVATPPEVKMGPLKRFFTSFMLLFLTPLLRKTFTPKTLYKPNEDILEFIWRESSKGSKIAYIRYLKAFDGVSISETLEEIESQKIAIIPANDNVVPTEMQKEAYSRVCDKVVIVEECGHNIMLEKPSEFREILEKILKE